MISVPEQFSAATKAYLDSQLALFTTLNGRLIENVEKIIQLNVDIVKTSSQESEAATKQLFSAKDANELLHLNTAQTRPMAEKVLAYTRDLAAIATDSQAEFTRVMETQVAASNRKVQTLLEEVSKNAPAGSEQLTSFFKTAMDNANVGYEHLTKSTKQVVDALETSMNESVSKFSQANGRTTPRASAKK